MGRRFLVLILIISCIIVQGCQRKEYPVSLKQSVDNIVKIELVDETKTPTAIYLIEDTKVLQDIASDIAKLSCYKYWNDPSTMIGYLHIDISYADGSIELLGTDSLIYVPNNSDSVSSWFYVDFESMCRLFEKYTGDLPILPKK